MRRRIQEPRTQPSRPRSSAGALSRNEYEKLAEFRYQLARFLRRRKDAAREEGLQAQQYELLLAVAGLGSGLLFTLVNANRSIEGNELN